MRIFGQDAHNLHAMLAIVWHHYFHGTLPQANPNGNVVLGPVNTDKPTPPVPETFPPPPAVVVPITPVVVGHIDSPAPVVPPQAVSPPVAAPPEPVPVHDALLPRGVSIVTTEKAGRALVALDPAVHGEKFAGQAFAVWPMRALVANGSLEAALLEWNCGQARIMDANPNWIGAARTVRMVDNGLGGFQPAPSGDHGEQYIANAWNVGSDNATWDAVIDHLQNHWQMPTKTNEDHQPHA